MQRMKDKSPLLICPELESTYYDYRAIIGKVRAVSSVTCLPSELPGTFADVVSAYIII